MHIMGLLVNSVVKWLPLTNLNPVAAPPIPTVQYWDRNVAVVSSTPNRLHLTIPLCHGFPFSCSVPSLYSAFAVFVPFAIAIVKLLTKKPSQFCMRMERAVLGLMVPQAHLHGEKIPHYDMAPMRTKGIDRWIIRQDIIALLLIKDPGQDLLGQPSAHLVGLRPVPSLQMHSITKVSNMKREKSSFLAMEEIREDILQVMEVILEVILQAMGVIQGTILQVMPSWLHMKGSFFFQSQ